jgi:hypothetical protein
MMRGAQIKGTDLWQIIFTDKQRLALRETIRRTHVPTHTHRPGCILCDLFFWTETDEEASPQFEPEHLHRPALDPLLAIYDEGA